MPQFAEKQCQRILSFLLPTATVLLFSIGLCNGLNINHDTDQAEEKQLKSSMLKFLSLDEPPAVSEQDFITAEVPENVQEKYDNLMWKYMRESEDKTYERKLRSAEPSLSTLFRTAQRNQGIPGEVVFSNTFREKLMFDMEGKIPEDGNVAFAELKLYKKIPNRRRRGPNSRTSNTQQNRVQLSRRRQARDRRVHRARVSIFHTAYDRFGVERSQLLDSRMVMVNHSGWQSFDISRAIKQWQRHPQKVMSITFELRVDSVRPGRKAAETASLVRFAGQAVSHKSPRRPEIVIYTEKQQKTGPSDCSRETGNKCCRSRRYINFRELEWARKWIIQPSGYDAYQCGGTCTRNRWKFLPGTGPTCAATKTAPLPIMYLVKRDGATHIEVAEFPHMVVQECGCSLDQS
uniref:Lefty/antivin n=1 Tax=Phallusia mammillata TaxID=59560 RepID=A0A6F9DJ13_9ASCI|nr:lefty/antivin [Phallusia mammillata]